MKTHRMLYEQGLANNAVMGAADSVGYASHYFPMQELVADDPGNNDVGAGTRITRVADVAGDVVLAEADSVDTDRLVEVTTGNEPGNSVLMYGWSTDTINAWTSPGTNDYLIMICGVARQGSDHVSGSRDSDPDHGGAISFYYGYPGTGQLKVHPYYAVFSDGREAIDFSPQFGLMDYQLTTPLIESYRHRTPGQVICSCAAKRGDILEHWVDGSLQGQADIKGHPYTAGNSVDGNSNNLDTRWRNQDAIASGEKFSTGHGAYGVRLTCNANQAGTTHQYGCSYVGQPIDGLWNPSDGNISGVCDNSNDVYFILVRIFENGLPDDIGEAMDKMQAEAIAGRKYIWPAWQFEP